jgi:hypothetical protein
VARVGVVAPSLTPPAKSMSAPSLTNGSPVREASCRALPNCRAGSAADAPLLVAPPPSLCSGRSALDNTACPDDWSGVTARKPSVSSCSSDECRPGDGVCDADGATAVGDDAPQPIAPLLSAGAQVPRCYHLSRPGRDRSSRLVACTRPQAPQRTPPAAQGQRCCWGRRLWWRVRVRLAPIRWLPTRNTIVHHP